MESKAGVAKVSKTPLMAIPFKDRLTPLRPLMVPIRESPLDRAILGQGHLPTDKEELEGHVTDFDWEIEEAEWSFEFKRTYALRITTLVTGTLGHHLGESRSTQMLISNGKTPKTAQIMAPETRAIGIFYVETPFDVQDFRCRPRENIRKPKWDWDNRNVRIIGSQHDDDRRQFSDGEDNVWEKAGEEDVGILRNI